MLGIGELIKHKKIEKKLTSHAKNSLVKALAIAKKEGSLEIENIHFLYSIYLEKGSAGQSILKDFSIKKADFGKILTLGGNKNHAKETGNPAPSAQFKHVFTRAFALAKELNYSYVGTEHFLCSILTSPDKKIKAFLNPVKNEKIEQLPKIISQSSQLVDFSGFLDESAPYPAIPPFWPKEIIKKPKNFPKETPYLNKFCLNLNEEIKKRKENVIGREKETERMMGILGRKNKNNPLLIGPPGVGKTALVWKMAELLNQNDVPKYLSGKTIMGLDVASLVAGTGFRGEFEMRLKEIIKELAENRHIILFIDELHSIIGAGNISGSLDLANIIKPALSRGDIQIIGATTQKEYKKHIEKDPALERRFQPIAVKEPTLAEAREILLGIKSSYELFHNVSIPDSSIDLCIQLSSRYIRDRFLPDKAIDVLDEAASNFRIQNKMTSLEQKVAQLEQEKKFIQGRKEECILQENYEKAINLRTQEKKLAEKIEFLKSQPVNSGKEIAVIGSRDIIKTVAKISGIPEDKLSRTSNKKIKDVAKILNSQIIGQREAIKNISNVLLKSQFGLSSPDRPLGSFLFLGPSGVGKTHAAKVLAREFFYDPKSLVRFDMSEFMERHSVSALIGSPAGYVGYGEGGRLTEKIRQNPYSVVLFDEIEKAHGDVFNVLLQILEDGILTDAEGIVVSFKNTIIVLTTNIGTEEFNAVSPGLLGFKTGHRDVEVPDKMNDVKRRVLEELEDRMRLELLNRLDHIVVFNPLSRSDIKKITDFELENLKERMEKQGLKLNIASEATRIIAKNSLSKDQGARLVRKNISEMIENKIAEMMVREKIKKNTITIGISNGKIKLK